VAFNDTECPTGDAAKKQVAINPKNTISDAKRLIGRRFDYNFHSDMKHWPFTVVNDCGKPKIQVQHKGETSKFAAEDISSMVLTTTKATAEAFLGNSAGRCRHGTSVLP
jgi:L1 cell adhesion molecule like protein